MFTLEESKFLLEKLDITPITGHKERVHMNNIVAKIVTEHSNQMKNQQEKERVKVPNETSE